MRKLPFALIMLCPGLIAQSSSTAVPNTGTADGTGTSREKKNPDQWEYRTVHSDADLNNLVSQGWEFVTMSSDGQGQHYLLRRLKQDSSTEAKGASRQDTVYKAGGDVIAPLLYHKIEASYTLEAQAKHIEGTVVLYLEVNPDGIPENIRVIRSLDPGLDRNAIDAVRKWRFRPGRKTGKPVTVSATVNVDFQLLAY
jgi:TonB family protein